MTTSLRAIDLNLLVVLDALLEERHVGRAAARVGLSQPATSAALARCRHLFGDPLLERRAGGMQPTPRGEALRGPLRALLADTAALIDPQEVALADVVRRVRIGMADYPALPILGPLVADLAASAPGIDLVVMPWHGAEAARRALIAGTLDIGVSVFASGDDALALTGLLTDRYVVTMRDGHPLAGGSLAKSDWLACAHVVVSGQGDARTALDAVLATEGEARRVAVTVPSFALVPPVLRATDHVALLPSAVARLESGLIVLDPPVNLGALEVRIARHRRRADDPVLRHVAERIVTAGSSLQT